MNGVEIILIFLFCICVVAFLARRVGMAYPIAFVLSGMVLAIIPDFPDFTIPPEMILLIFLPLLLTEAAYFTSLRDFKANLRPILQLAIGLVVVTCIVVAYVVEQLVPGMGLAAGFVFGAIISPPDAVAAVSVTRHTILPKRVMTVLEGESLVNDATGLVLYKFAVAAVVTGSFSLLDVSINFLWMATSGTAIGFLAGYAYVKLYPRIREMSVEILSTLIAPYVVYLLAEAFHSSGVLAVVTYGLTVGWHGPKLFGPKVRIPTEAVWKMVTFILNGLVFLLIGLYFPRLLANLNQYSVLELLSLGLLVSLAAIVTRIAYVYAVAYGARFLSACLRKKDPYPSWQNVFIVAWTGMRGVVSLATALAIPLTIANGSAFPYRDLIIFLAFSVILVTLVLQGISLPWLVRKLSLRYDGMVLYEEWQAKKEAAEIALKRLEELKSDPSIQSAALERIMSHYCDRLRSLGDGPNTPLSLNEAPTAESHPIIQSENKIWKEVLEVERNSVIKLRQAFKISDDVMHDILRDIDLLHNRFANNA